MTKNKEVISQSNQTIRNNTDNITSFGYKISKIESKLLLIGGHVSMLDNYRIIDFA
jgi:hypothetical protein